MVKNMNESNKAVKSVFIIILFTLSSKILGFIREMLIAAKFGLGVETDAYFIAITSIGLFTIMITESINTTMIPILSEIQSIEGREGKKIHTNNILNIIILISLFIVIISGIFAPYIVRIVASGFKGEQFKLAVLMTRIGLPAVLFAGIHGVLKGYLQSESKFIRDAAAQIPLNLVYIFFLVFLSSFFGIKGLMFTFVIATASQILVQMPGMKNIVYQYNFTIDFKDKYVKKMFYLIPPILISVGINDLNQIIDRTLASTLASGSISALNYGHRLDSLTTGIFVSAINTVIYPMLSKEGNKSNYNGFKKVIIRGINIILLITIPATIGMIILVNPIVKIAFQRGAFDSTAKYMTVGALAFYSIGLVGNSLLLILNNVYYSIQDTKTPMINSLITVILNIILNLLLIKFMAHRGLALATSISVNISSLLLLYRLKRKIGSFGFNKSIKCGVKSLIAATFMGIIVYFINLILSKHIGIGRIGELINLLISVGIGGSVYLILIYLFKVEEVDWIIKTIKNKLK